MMPLDRATSRPALLAWLTLVWVGLWGTLSWANLLGGIGVAVVLLLTLPLPPVASAGVLHPRALARFVGSFAVDLVSSTWQVARLVLRRRRPLQQAVIAVPVRGASDQLLTLLANTISLTPGTLTLEVDRPRSTLFVHVLDVGDATGGVDGVRAQILEVERLAILAMGSADCRQALATDHPEAGR